MSTDGSNSEDRWLARLLSRLVERAQRRAGLTVVLTLVLTGVLGVYANRNIGFNADPNSLFSADLRFQHAIRRFSRYFPVLTNSLLIVVEGETPEQTREAAKTLLVALADDTTVFHRAFQPGEDLFFELHGLLYGTVEEVDDFADHMALLQPVLGQLAADLSVPTLASVVETGLEHKGASETHAEGWEMVLTHLRSATDAAREGDSTALSWERVLITGSGFEPMNRSLLVADPILDFDDVFAAERAIDAVHETARRVGLVPENGVLVRVTGYPALNYEEMMGLARDTGVAGALSFVLVVLLLSGAFRSGRLVLAAALTLIAGLIWAAAFSAVAVGELNPVSITFGVLVIGLGIDFMIHLGMHFVDGVRAGKPVAVALDRAVSDTGTAIVLCAGTTSVGFLAFVPTDFRGISDLGLAAVGGILSILLLTLTFFPALIRLLLTSQACGRLQAHGPARGIRLWRARRPAVVVTVAAVVGLLALPLVRQVDLDTNVISFRNQKTESVQAFKALLTSQATTPWFLDALVPSLDRAVELAEQMRELPEVDKVVTLADLVPDDQEEKLEILADVSMMLGLPATTTRRRTSVAEQIAALRELRAFLATGPAEADTPLADSIEQLGASLDAFLAVAGRDDGRAMRQLADVLLDPVPDQLDRLRANLAVERVTRDDLPPDLVSRMLSTDGHARIQVYPSVDLWDHEAMVGFVEAIRPIWGDITGLPVNLVESARATWSSLRGALVGATAAITVLLLALWRRVGVTMLVLGPLLLAVLLTQVSTIVLPVSFNFANVIVLPLLLGIGVDSGIHLVERAERLGGTSAALLETTTARAVLFSALTTMASFGTLTVSAHRGVSSLGLLLVVGMIWTLAANLVLLPALLALRERWRSSWSVPVET
jgi:hopanoid biosynthesis associated RND transporter like protein HpnN